MGKWKRRQFKKQQAEKRAAKAALSEFENMNGSSDWFDDYNPLSTLSWSRKTTLTTPGIPGWTWKERRGVLRYLEQYKAGCECIYAGLDPTYYCQSSSNRIGFVDFPILTREVFEQPFLELPTTLTKKNRKMIHECCAESFIFHITTGDRHHHTSLHRTMILSIYVDGFDTIPDLDQQILPRAPPRNDRNEADGTVFYHPPIHNYRPWYALQDRPWLLDPIPSSKAENGSSTPVPPNSGSSQSSKAKSLDTAGKRRVDALVDNPEACFRDDLDVFDFAKWDKQDLSTIPPPTSGPQNGNEKANQWTLVDTPEKMNALVAELHESCPTEIAFDLESLNKNKFCQLTCLLQITWNTDHDYVIDTLAPGVWDLIGPGLAPFFANPRIVKIGHSIGGLDVRSLHRDFGIFVINAFDTYEAAQVLGLSSQGLASVCAHYGLKDSEHYKELKALYQATDWRARPLTEPMIEYGRYDVHYLLRLRWLMIRDLTRAELYDRTESARDEDAIRVANTMASALARFNEDEDEVNDDNWNNGSNEQDHNVFTYGEEDEINNISNDSMDDFDEAEENGDRVLSPQNSKASAALLRMQPSLMKVISRSQERCRYIWTGRSEPFLTHPMYVNILHRARREEVVWTTQHKKLYEKIIQWRNQVAQEREILPGFVAPLEFLIPVALQQPRSVEALRRVSYRFPELLEEDRDCRESLLDVVRNSIANTSNRANTNSNDNLLSYNNPDPVQAARIQQKREKQLKRRRRRSRKLSFGKRKFSPVAMNAESWKALAVVAVAAVAAFVIASYRRKR